MFRVQHHLLKFFDESINSSQLKSYWRSVIGNFWDFEIYDNMSTLKSMTICNLGEGCVGIQQIRQKPVADSSSKWQRKDMLIFPWDRSLQSGMGFSVFFTRAIDLDAAYLDTEGGCTIMFAFFSHIQHISQLLVLVSVLGKKSIAQLLGKSGIKESMQT
uniref:Uncharacterized protein n=1 Tax=Opuntia streptacantha TaxID=393608 RepID=A0A7C9DWU6_OPUST